MADFGTYIKEGVLRDQNPAQAVCGQVRLLHLDGQMVAV